MSRESLGSVDTAWLHMDRPTNTADVVSVLALDAPLSLAELRGLVESRLLAHERFRRRIVAGGLLGGAALEEDAHLSLDRHVLHRQVAHGRAALERFVSAVATEPLDLAHPPWRVYLVDGAGRGSAVVVKLHHCLADGFALVGVLLSLADDPLPAERPEHRVRAFRDLAFRRDPLAAIRSALGDWPRARELALHGAAFGASLARMIALPPDPRTVLRRPLTGIRRAAWSRGFPLASVRAAARAAGGTVNDVLVAALAGALRGHLAARGERVDAFDVRAIVPVNLRPVGPSPDLGNRFGLVFLELPIHAASPRLRLEAARARMLALKSSADAAVTYGVLAALGAIPAAAERLVNAFFTSKASLVVTNLPGPRQPLHLLGRRLEHLMFWVPHPASLGLGVSILSYAGEVRIGVRADAAVVPRPADLVARFGAELEALGAAPPPRRRACAPASRAHRPAEAAALP